MKLSLQKAVLVTTLLISLLCTVALVVAVRSKAGKPSRRAAGDNEPRVILWAWERPSDLRFIDPRQVGVAFLAQTIFLRGEDVVVRPRLQTLEVPSGTKLIAVTRVESKGVEKPRLSSEQRLRLALSIAEVATLSHVSAIQIDFDATRSERDFYRDLILEVRRRLPPETGLSITALASWCADDDWLAELPIDDAVPMLFRMGPDRHQILNRVSDGNQLSVALCRNTYGISTDEPVPALTPGKRVYVFNPHAWSQDSVRAVLDSIK